MVAGNRGDDDQNGCEPKVCPDHATKLQLTST